MEKFTRVLRGYDPNEVNAFLDQVINKVETMISELKGKNEKIRKITNLEEENLRLKDKILQYERMEESLNRAILMAERTGEQIKLSAHQESDAIINDAKRNASRIVNDALIKAEKAEDQAEQLKRNVNIFKKRLRDIIESQIEVVNDIDKIEL